VWCDVVWYAVVSCFVVWRVWWCGVLRCGVLWCSVLWCGCGVLWCGVMHVMWCVLNWLLVTERPVYWWLCALTSYWNNVNYRCGGLAMPWDAHAFAMASRQQQARRTSTIRGPAVEYVQAWVSTCYETYLCYETYRCYYAVEQLCGFVYVHAYC